MMPQQQIEPARPPAIDLPVAKRYPRFAAYVDGLPQGLDSHPECITKASLALMLVRGIPQPPPSPQEVPDPLRRYLSAPPSGMWVPEVEAMALSLLVADHYRMTDRQHREWIKARNRGFFSSLMYRAVMSFLSPQSLMTKATARWAAVHRGSTFTVKFVGPRDVDGILTFPHRLFPKIALEQLTAVFAAALENSNAHNTEVVLAEATDTRGVFHGRWE